MINDNKARKVIKVIGANQGCRTNLSLKLKTDSQNQGQEYEIIRHNESFD